VTTVDRAGLDRASITGIDIAVYHTRDAARSIAFYRDVLGIQPSDVDAQGRGAEFALADGSTLGVWNTGQGDAGGIMMFAVGDIGAALTRFRGNGASIGDPMETDVCFMAVGNDPDGNRFIIHQRKDTAA
jgi:predicted enzyme related to lactoylglutathione lyase